MILSLLGCLDGSGKPAADRDSETDSGPADTGRDSATATDTGESAAPPDSTGDTSVDDSDDSATEVDTAVRLVTDANFILVGSDVFEYPPTDPIVADWNGDGRLDLGVTVAYGTTDARAAGDGVAYRLTDLTLGRVELGTVTERFLGTGTSEGLQLHDAADLDGDGFDDALLQERRDDNSGRLAVLLGPFSGDLDPRDAGYSIHGEPDYPVAQVGARAADLDGDGQLEILAAGYSTLGSYTYGAGSLSVYPATGTGEHDASEATAWIGCADDAGCWGFAWTLQVADGNGDGVNDVWASAYAADDYTGTVWVFDGPFEGARVETDADVTRTGPVGGQYGGQVLPCDFDMDGVLDLAAWAGSDDSFEENGGGIYVESGPVAGVGEAPALAGIVLHGTTEHSLGFPNAVDMDADGRCDLLATVQDSTVRGDLYRWSSLPAGTAAYTSGERIVTGPGPYDSAGPLLTPDLDVDGIPDLLLHFFEEDQTAMGLFYGSAF